MKFYWLALGALAVWRITHMLHAEDGPWAIFARLQELVARGFWYELLGCFYCLSVWIAAPFAAWLGDTWKERLLLWPALSAASIVIERLSAPGLSDSDSNPALFFEASEGEENVLLRKEERRSGDAGRVH